MEGIRATMDVSFVSFHYARNGPVTAVREMQLTAWCYRSNLDTCQVRALLLKSRLSDPVSVVMHGLVT
jgi:hypothetical protein